MSFALVVFNAGPSAAENITITDAVPAAFPVLSVSGGGSITATFAGQNVQGVLGLLPANASATLTIVVSLSNATSGTLSATNLAQVTSTTPDPVPGNNTATSTITIDPRADLRAVIAFPANATVGATITATVTYVNLGTSTAANVTQSVVIGTTGGTVTATGPISVGSIAPLGTVVYTISFVVPATQVYGTATITSTTADPTPTNNIGTTTTVLGTLADVSVTLSLPNSAAANTTATGVVTFFNVGTANADNVTRSVAISGGTLTAVAAGGTVVAGSVTVTFNVGTMAVGSSASFTFTYVMPASGSVNATASIATTSTETNTANNRAIGMTSVSGVGVDLSISLVVNPGSTAVGTRLLSVGANVIQAVVTNVGAVASVGTLTVTLPGLLPATTITVTFTLASSLGVGQTVGFTTSYTMGTQTTAAQTFSAVVSAGGAETNLTNNSVTAVVGVGANLSGRAWIDVGTVPANRQTYQSGTDVTLPNLLVRLYKTNTATLVATAYTKADGTYEIRGVAPGTDYIVRFFSCTSQANPASCTAIGTTPLNQGPLTERYNVANNATTTALNPTPSVNGTTIGNAITLITLVAGDNTNNQNLPLDPRGIVYASTVNEFGVTRGPVQNAVVTFTGPVGFDITRIQNGNGVISTQQITGADGSYQFLLLPGFTQGTYTLSVQAPTGYTPATVSLTSFAAAGGVVAPTPFPFSPIPAGLQPVVANPLAPQGAQPTTYHLVFNFNNASGDVINNHIPLDPVGAAVPPAPVGTDLSIVKTGQTTLVAGDTATYTLQVLNAGPTVATNLTVTDILPAGLTLLSASVQPANALNLNISPTGLVATTASFALGGVTVTLTVRVDASLAGTTVTNAASVASTVTDTSTANNTSTFASRVLGTDLALNKTGPATVTAGGFATYTLVVTNAGPSTARNVTVTDILRDGATLVSASVLSGSLTLVTTTGSLTALAQNLPVGTSAISLSVLVADTAIGTLTNVANVTSTTPDSIPGNNTGTATSTVLGADIGVLKLGPPSISAAGTATYTLILFNNGPSVAANVTLTDILPTGLTLVSALSGTVGSLTLQTSADRVIATTSVLRIGTVTVTLTVQVDYTATATITNVASATSTTPDPTTTNNIGSVTSSVREVESGVLLVNKTGSKSSAEVGDSVQYTIRIRNTIGLPVSGIVLEDLLPAGFRYILGTARINNAEVPNPEGGVGRQLRFNIGTLAGNAVVEVSYFVRLGVGSQQGDGTNRATAVFPGARGAPIRSNTALFKVNVLGGVFSNEGCITGKVFVDCDGNFVQNNDSGSRELGIPGVRLVMLDGTYLITDNEGKYSICGIKSQTHVLKVDRSTLPIGSRLVPSSNRNAGVGDSIFIDLKSGELGRADFIEGSCSPGVMEQVKQRRGQQGTALPEAPASGLTPLGERLP
ncbi:MAG: beta strand repeat-containing protein [Burkholderiales bacterium]